ncbi:MAG: hypothetical protein HYU52_15240 [Acidobacteria bacterium]|nr:hypothetical protein [Acidobacteriota bacterium]
MGPVHAQKRLDAFLRILRNAGLAEAGVARIHGLASAYETDRNGPPASQDDVLSWVKGKAFASEQEQRAAEAFLGAYLVFNSPSSELDVSALVQGVLALEADTVIKVANQALEGEGPLGRVAARTMSFLTRETVRQWLAPIGAIALVVLAFLENPAFIFMRMMNPSPTKALRELDMSAPAVQSAYREAELARDLMRTVTKRWKGAPPRSIEDLAALSAAPSDFASLVDTYALDTGLWPRDGTTPATAIVLRGTKESKRVILAGPDAVTVIDPEFVITAGGYR